MKFYVPTIGDKIYLLEDWHFTLHEESRNRSLAKKMDLISPGQASRTYWRVNKVWEEKRYSFNRHPEYRNVPKDYTPVGNEKMQPFHANQGEDHAYQETHTWETEVWNASQEPVWLPRKTELTIDRIYIRKGKGDYDSITFRITACEANKKLVKSRFWTKLRDANRIVCQLQPVYDIDAPVAVNRFELLDD